MMSQSRCSHAFMTNLNILVGSSFQYFLLILKQRLKKNFEKNIEKYRYYKHNSVRSTTHYYVIYRERVKYSLLLLICGEHRLVVIYKHYIVVEKKGGYTN